MGFIEKMKFIFDASLHFIFDMNFYDICPSILNHINFTELIGKHNRPIFALVTTHLWHSDSECPVEFLSLTEIFLHFLQRLCVIRLMVFVC